MPVDKNAPVQNSILSVEPAGVIVTAFKPSEDGKARIVRLFNTGGRPEKARLIWALASAERGAAGKPAPKTVWLSNLAEKELSKITGPIDIAPYEIVTLRVQLGR